MTTQDALLRASATELAARLAAGEVSSAECVEAFIAQIERVNERLNAVVVKRYAEVRVEAKEADARRTRGERLGPLHGVPVTVKECLDLVGTPSTFGIPSRASHRARSAPTSNGGAPDFRSGCRSRRGRFASIMRSPS